METRAKVDALKKHLFAQARASGEVGLWVFNDTVAGELGLDADEPRVRRATMRVVRELLGEGLVRAGFPTREGRFEGWSSDVEETVGRIERGWDDLGGGEPGIGDVVWFEAVERAE